MNILFGVLDLFILGRKGFGSVVPTMRYPQYFFLVFPFICLELVDWILFM
jgi:hypothetical protein